MSYGLASFLMDMEISILKRGYYEDIGSRNQERSLQGTTIIISFLLPLLFSDSSRIISSSSSQHLFPNHYFIPKER